MKLDREPLSIRLPLYARKEFTISGKLFRTGSLFDWERRSISRRKLEQLWRLRFIDHAEPEVVTPPSEDPVIESGEISGVEKQMVMTHVPMSDIEKRLLDILPDPPAEPPAHSPQASSAPVRGSFTPPARKGSGAPGGSAKGK